MDKLRTIFLYPALFIALMAIGSITVLLSGLKKKSRGEADIHIKL